MSEGARQRERLRYILQSIEIIKQYTAVGSEAFYRELMIQDAVLRRLETLADAASHLSDALKARHSEIPWRRIVAFRNIAAHAYETLHLDAVWEIVEFSLPSLKAAVQAELGSAP